MKLLLLILILFIIIAGFFKYLKFVSSNEKEIENHVLKNLSKKE